MRAPRTRTLVEGIFGIPQGYLLLGHSPIFPQKPSNKTQGQPRRGVECSPCIFMILGTQIFNVACTHHLSMIIRSEGGTLGLILGVSRPQGPQDQMGTSALPSALPPRISPGPKFRCLN